MKDDNVVCCLQVLQLVRDQKSSFALQEVTDAVVKQMAPHVGIYRRQWVIKYIYLGLLVNSPVNKNRTQWCIVSLLFYHLYCIVTIYPIQKQLINEKHIT
jgi:hypothetical protein